MSTNGNLAEEPGFATKAIHVGQEPERWSSRSVVAPIVLSPSFKQQAPSQHKGFEYGRSGNPSRKVLEQCLASLDNGKFGLCFSSGLAAATTVISLLSAGDHIVVMDDLYGGTYELLTEVIERRDVQLTFVDARYPDRVASVIQRNTRMVWIESPTNPLMGIVDIKKVSEIVHAYKEIILVVDNTFLSSYFQRPLMLGADIVLYSLTKYLNGHTDVIMGALVMNNKEYHKSLKFLQNSLGAVPSPFDCFMVNRGLKTLALRMEQHMKNGLAIGCYLEKHPLVKKVLHPGLPSHPQHQLANSQSSGHSGMLSFYIEGGLEESHKFLSSLKIFTLGTSLGGFESLAMLCSQMSHAPMPIEERIRLGITDNLIRLSVGLEAAEELIGDLDQAFKVTKMSGEGFLVQEPGFATKAIHAGQDPEQWSSWCVVPPISLSTSFKQEAPAQHKGFDYSRSGNPTRDVLQRCLASLDNGKYGLCFSSGLAATTNVLSLLNAGDHIIAMDDLYGGTYRLLSKVIDRMNIKTTFVDARDPEKVKEAIQENTKLVWIETPTNPLLKVVDIKRVAEIVHAHKGIILAVDNTFLSSYFQRPLMLGADLVVYSLTKYMNGHTDVVMGAVVTNSEELHERLKFLQKSIGAVPSPFDCYLVNRGLKTLALRMEQHMKNGLAVGRFLETHRCVEKVLNPGLPSHPQHELVKRQSYGHSGIMSFYLKGGLEESRKFLSSLKVFTLAESLGGYESLAELPSLMTHASVPAEERARIGVTDSLIRLSVGLESIQDLLDDLDQALNLAVK